MFFNMIQIVNFPAWVSPHALYTLFAPFGTVLHIGGILGTSCVDVVFEREAFAKGAISALQGVVFAGVSLQMVLVGQNAMKTVPPSMLAPPLTPLTATSGASSPNLSPLPSPSVLCSPLQSPSPTALTMPPRTLTLTTTSTHGFGSRSHARAWQAPLSSAMDQGRKSRCTNVYVLNLSLDVDNEELKRLCATYGEVKHVCVLATLDHAGRRRAFVDMATPHQAQTLISGLTRRRLHGYELHASYAFVQRSGGPNLTMGDGKSGRARVCRDDDATSFGYASNLEERMGGGGMGHGLGAGLKTVQSVRIKVCGLSPHAFIDGDDVARLFTERGFGVRWSRLQVSLTTGISLGYGIVELEAGAGGHDGEDEGDVHRAMEAVHGLLVAGERISCQVLKR